MLIVSTLFKHWRRLEEAQHTSFILVLLLFVVEPLKHGWLIVSQTIYLHFWFTNDFCDLSILR